MENKLVPYYYKEISEKYMVKNKKINLWKICTYFIIYSLLGYIIETIFGIITTGL